MLSWHQRLTSVQLLRPLPHAGQFRVNSWSQLTQSTSPWTRGRRTQRRLFPTIWQLVRHSQYSLSSSLQWDTLFITSSLWYKQKEYFSLFTVIWWLRVGRYALIRYGRMGHVMGWCWSSWQFYLFLRLVTNKNGKTLSFQKVNQMGNNLLTGSNCFFFFCNENI